MEIEVSGILGSHAGSQATTDFLERSRALRERSDNLVVAIKSQSIGHS